MLAVADTGPLHYLVLVGHAQTLGALFTAVVIPEVVRDELAHPNAPAPVRAWIRSPPAWLSIDPEATGIRARLDETLDDGERAVIALALERRPALVLMDDRAGVAAAREEGFVVTGTLGLLVRAAARGLLDLADAFDALGRTNFHWTPVLRERLLAEHLKRVGAER